jgi:FixJ family two-component response regulator
VFVVDDDEAVRDALTTTLVASGFAVAGFRSAEQFLEGYRSGGPACLIVELDLPEFDGMALLRMLPAAGIDMPVIATSRRLRLRRLSNGLAACVGVLEKPFGHEELLHLVHAALASVKPPYVVHRITPDDRSL